MALGKAKASSCGFGGVATYHSLPHQHCCECSFNLTLLLTYFSHMTYISTKETEYKSHPHPMLTLTCTLTLDAFISAAVLLGVSVTQAEQKFLFIRCPETPEKCWCFSKQHTFIAFTVHALVNNNRCLKDLTILVTKPKQSDSFLRVTALRKNFLLTGR